MRHIKNTFFARRIAAGEIEDVAYFFKNVGQLHAVNYPVPKDKRPINYGPYSIIQIMGLNEMKSPIFGLVASCLKF
jgi:hypothetical protein